MSNKCSNEICWIDSVIKNKKKKEVLKKQLFVPRMPNSWKKNLTEWLSSTEIIDVMKQYEETYDNFVFLGPSPIDFNSINIEDTKDICVWPELCHFNLKKHISKNIKYIGMVFNLDKHYEAGSHWYLFFRYTI